MKHKIDKSKPLVSGKVVEAAASGSQEARDAIVDAYADVVWAVAHRWQLDRPRAIAMSRLTWMRFHDRLGGISPESIRVWLEQTAERECTRLARLSQIGAEDEAYTA
jgi:hypothetical protein